MATLTLLPRKKFEIKLESDEVVTGQFGTWAMKRFCDRMGVTLSGISEKLKAYETEGDLNVITHFVLSGVEQSFRETGRSDFKYNDANVLAWIDEMGGLDSPDFVALFGHANSEFEKKSQPETNMASPSNG